MRLHLRLVHSAPRGAISPPDHVEVPPGTYTLVRDGAGRRWRIIDIEADIADDAGARVIAYVLPGDPSGPPPPPPHAAPLTVQEAATTAAEMLRIVGATPEMVAAVQRLDGLREAISWAIAQTREHRDVEPLLSLARLLTLAHDAANP